VERVSADSLAARADRLDAMEAELRKALAKKPPKLPKIPRYPPVKIPRPSPASRVVQVAFAPVTPSTAGRGGDAEHEDEHEDEGDD
jgi:hypothetical protein